LGRPLALVVEDNEDQADIMAKALKAAGFDTEIIGSGTQALARLGIVVPALVILDLHLPGISGTGVLLEIGADPRLAETCVIVVTVEPQAADALDNLANLVLVKPVDFMELHDLAASLLQDPLTGG
jgi:DNA-binding response OmpR family regulator